MISSRRRAGLGKRAAPGCHACGLVIAWCMGHGMLWPSAAAQAPSASRQELMRKWDIDRDGKVDASEAEIARGRMRRARTDAAMNSGIDPVTGKPRVATDPVTGRPVPPDAAAANRGGLSAPADEDGLILVPGNGERPEGAGGTAAGTDMPPRPSQRDREQLPGTRAPAMSSTIPSVTPRSAAGVSAGAPLPNTGPRSPLLPSAAGRQAQPGGRQTPSAGQGPMSPRDAGGGELSSRARVLPGTPPGQTPNTRGPQSFGAGQDRQQLGARPGIIAGGVRAGAPGARPGYGAGGVPADLNAGRPMGQMPSVPRPGIGPYRGPTPPGMPAVGAPAVGVPSTPRPGMGQTDRGRSMSGTPNTVPRVPRMTSDEFYGR
jgi:hypothetical protein